MATVASMSGSMMMNSVIGVSSSLLGGLLVSFDHQSTKGSRAHRGPHRKTN